MKIALETVTPDKARHILTNKNTGNRPLRDTWIENLATQITDGNWKITHQGIAFDDDGNLIDGQHRLNAIIRANKPAQMYVARGIPADLYRYIDGGRTRTDADRIKLMDGANENVFAIACTRSFLQLSNTVLRGAVNVDQIENTFLEMADGFAAVAQEFSKHRTAYVTRAPIGAAIATYVHTHKKKGMEFLKSYVSGENLAALSPILALREAARSKRIKTPSDAYWKTINATRHFHEGRQMHNLSPTTIDWFDNKYTSEIHARVRKSIEGGETKRTQRILGEITAKNGVHKPTAKAPAKAVTAGK